MTNNNNEKNEQESKKELAHIHINIHSSSDLGFGKKYLIEVDMNGNADEIADALIAVFNTDQQVRMLISKAIYRSIERMHVSKSVKENSNNEGVN